jgi:hypothetical protein
MKIVLSFLLTLLVTCAGVAFVIVLWTFVNQNPWWMFGEAVIFSASVTSLQYWFAKQDEQGIKDQLAVDNMYLDSDGAHVDATAHLS